MGFFFYQVTGNEEVERQITSPVSSRNSSNICLKKLAEAVEPCCDCFYRTPNMQG